MGQKIIDRGYVGEVLQQIYNSDLQISISLLSNGGYYYATAGDKRVPLQGTTVEEAVTHLAFRLAKEFPESRFAEWWGANFHQQEQGR